MPFLSITRLRIRSWRFLPGFVFHTFKSLQQIKASTGFREGSVLADRRWTFWTMTAWDSQEHMRQYITAGSHKVAMPKLMHWCDEASIAHWDQAEDALPSWAEADARMRGEGRVSKVRHPSPTHADLRYAAPRLYSAGPIRPARRP